MQKKLIALAVAGLASTAAFAQSNVTVYGIMDMGYVNYSSHTTAGTASVAKIDEGLQSGGSRLGFKGTEDLGNGLKANFLVETGLAADAPAASSLGDRSSTVGLSGNFGALNLGRQYTPIHSVQGATDTFGAGGVGNIYALNRGSVRNSNSVRYDSPSFNGLGIAAMVGMGETAGSTAYNRETGLNATYANGPLFVGLGYAKINNATDTLSGSQTTLGASYNFGVAKGFASYTKNSKYDYYAGTKIAAGQDDKSWQIGAIVPVGKANVRVAYTKLSDSAAAAQDARMISLAYEYGLSKRTMAYARYADVNNSNAGVTSLSGANTAGYTNGFAVGLRHDF